MIFLLIYLLNEIRFFVKQTMATELEWLVLKMKFLKGIKEVMFQF